MRNRSRVASSSSLITVAPIITSECPFMYLVKEYTTISAPKSSGLCRRCSRRILAWRLCTTSLVTDQTDARARCSLTGQTREVCGYYEPEIEYYCGRLPGIIQLSYITTASEKTDDRNWRGN
ncbi:hypothetical protein MSG28_011127 [Choristoneura fumiferana]|uniref:Uncharacterized protein n=1 Tax=Choristoneura fumiferana TaxID=7141 RepID=A0ACC0KQU9_CHOFU|nr:hypothetical protein MSG28_011127 [Choristoneura fumiferana]